MNEKVELAKLIGVMAAAYPNTQVSDATIDVYVMMLADIPIDTLTAVVQQCMAESDFLPSVAKLRESALAIVRPSRMSALEAWGVVKQSMNEVGVYRSPKFDDPLIAKAVDCMGWKTLCSSENEPADRAHFSKVYESLVAREQNDARMLPVVRELQAGIQKMISNRSM